MQRENEKSGRSCWQSKWKSETWRRSRKPADFQSTSVLSHDLSLIRQGRSLFGERIYTSFCASFSLTLDLSKRILYTHTEWERKKTGGEKKQREFVARWEKFVSRIFGGQCTQYFHPISNNSRLFFSFSQASRERTSKFSKRSRSTSALCVCVSCARNPKCLNVYLFVLLDVYVKTCRCYWSCVVYIYIYSAVVWIFFFLVWFVGGLFEDLEQIVLEWWGFTLWSIYFLIVSSNRTKFITILIFYTLFVEVIRSVEIQNGNFIYWSSNEIPKSYN